MDKRSNPSTSAELQRDMRALELASAMIRKREGTILFWGRGMEVLYGYTAAEAVGASSHELLRTEFAQPLAEIEAELTERGEWAGEVAHYRRDGSRRTIATQWSLWDDAGMPAVTVINNDITELRAAEQDLFARQAHLNSILETVPDAMIVLSGDGAILQFSAAAEELWGYRASEVVGRHFTMLIPSDEIEADQEILQRFIETGEGLVGDRGRRLQRRDVDGRDAGQHLADAGQRPARVGLGAARRIRRLRARRAVAIGLVLQIFVAALLGAVARVVGA